MADANSCKHAGLIREVTPSALGCEECLKIGSAWVHLRLCRICGHVGCCDDSPHRHATKHFHATGHPIIEGYDPPEGWGWCYVDKVYLDFSNSDDSAQRANSALRMMSRWMSRALTQKGAVFRICGEQSVRIALRAN
jgi:hypothetical protein